MAGGTRYVALLRGINVGGHAKVPMAELRAVVESTGCTDVSTYIQSGNVALSSDLAEPDLRASLESAITDRLGVSPTVMIRSAAQMADVVAGTPYPDATDTVHVAFLHEPPGRQQAIAALDCRPEELAVAGREIYLLLPSGMGRAKLPVELGKVVADPMTVRNWRTVTRLAQMTG